LADGRLLRGDRRLDPPGPARRRNRPGGEPARAAPAVRRGGPVRRPTQPRAGPAFRFASERSIAVLQRRWVTSGGLATTTTARLAAGRRGSHASPPIARGG